MRHNIPFRPDIPLDPAAAVWNQIPELSIAHFHPRSANSRPTATAKLAHSGRAIGVRFAVDDPFVRATRTQYQDMVCRDSCVELFLQPAMGGGYFNFEVSCIGTMMLSYIQDPTRVGESFAKHTPVPHSIAQTIVTAGTFERGVPVERASFTPWVLTLLIPFTAMEQFTGPLHVDSGATWRGNLFKCGSEVLNPHWASWAPIGAELNFHQPARFGELHLGAPL